MGEFRLDARVLKVDSGLGLVFGWAVECLYKGAEVFDRQGDHIPESSMLEAATDFMLHRRVAKDMHYGTPQGTVVFAWPMTTDVAKAFGVETERTGLMVAVKPEPGLLADFQSGARTGFSIGGQRQEDEDVANGEITKYSDDQPRSADGKFATSEGSYDHSSSSEGGEGTSHAKVMVGQGKTHVILTRNGQQHLYSAEKEHKSLLKKPTLNDKDLKGFEYKGMRAQKNLAKYSEDQARDEGGRFTAGQLNAHLAGGGVVQMTTATRSTIYEQKHAGHFSEKNGNLHVKHGKGTNQLSQGNRMLVGLRTGRYVQKSDEPSFLKYSDDQPRGDDGKWSGGGAAHEGTVGPATKQEQKLFTSAHENLRALRDERGRLLLAGKMHPEKLELMNRREYNIQSYISHQLATRPGVEAHYKAKYKLGKSLANDEAPNIDDLVDLDNPLGEGDEPKGKRPKNKMKGSAKKPAPVDNSVPEST